MALIIAKAPQCGFGVGVGVGVGVGRGGEVAEKEESGHHDKRSPGPCFFNCYLKLLAS